MIYTNNNENRELLGYIKHHFDSDRVLIKDEFDTKSENFYLSGFEAIFINEPQCFAKKTVIASTISFDDEILLLKRDNRSCEVKEICTELGANYIEMEFCNNDKCILNVALLLNAHKDISHVYFEINESNFHIAEELAKICDLAHVTLITSMPYYDHVHIGKCIEYQVPFIIVPDFINDQKAMVIANRRNLVQTEGVSSSFTYDLYSFWQNSLDKRNSCISPMSA